MKRVKLLASQLQHLHLARDQDLDQVLEVVVEVVVAVVVNLNEISFCRFARFDM